MTSTSPKPVLLSTGPLVGPGDPFPDWPPEVLLEGGDGQIFQVAYSGEIDAHCYQVEHIKLMLDARSRWSFDEVVTVLGGELRAGQEGEPGYTVLKQGEFAFVPKEAAGVVEMVSTHGPYRDLAVTPGAAEYDLGDAHSAARDVDAVERKSVRSRVKLDVSQVAATGELRCNWPDEMLVEGGMDDVFKVLAQGDVVTAIYQTRGAKVRYDRPFPGDELVFVLEGELRIRTEESGTSVHPAGGMVVVPKGTVGVLEMTASTMDGIYRELAVASGALSKSIVCEQGMTNIR